MVESEIIVKIYLPEKDNQLITLKCSPDTTIEDITDSLENYLKLDPSRQTCFFRLPNFDRELKPHIQLDKIKQDSQGTIILHAFIGRQLTNTLMQTTLLAQTMLNQTNLGTDEELPPIRIFLKTNTDTMTLDVTADEVKIWQLIELLRERRGLSQGVILELYRENSQEALDPNETVLSCDIKNEETLDVKIRFTGASYRQRYNK